MSLHTRWGVGAAVGAAGASLLLGGLSPAAATPSEHAAPRAVVAQYFTLRLAGDPGQVANVSGSGTTNGTRVIQYPLSRTNNEPWEADSALGGYYRFKAVHSGKCLNVQGGGNANVTPVIQYTCGSSDNELWRFVPKGRGYQIVAKSSNKCLNVEGGTGAGNNLIQYDCVPGGASNDVWLPVWEPAH